MKTIRVLIADDEPLAREGVAVMLRDDPQYEVIAMCADGLSALEQIRELKPDVAFLDVQMPRLTGLEVCSQLAPPERPAVIFVTAYSDHAVKAFEMCAVDYVVKPFTDVRFRAALARTGEELLRGNIAQAQRRMDELLHRLQDVDARVGAKSAGKSRLGFKSGSEHVFINPEEIVWIEVIDDLVSIRAARESHAIRMTLTSLEQLLDPAAFVRVHRSFIVNRHRIARLRPSLYGDYEIVMEDNRKIRMSRTYRDRLKLLLGSGPAPAGIQAEPGR